MQGMSPMGLFAPSEKSLEIVAFHAMSKIATD